MTPLWTRTCFDILNSNEDHSGVRAVATHCDCRLCSTGSFMWTHLGCVHSHPGAGPLQIPVGSSASGFAWCLTNNFSALGLSVNEVTLYLPWGILAVLLGNLLVTPRVLAMVLHHCCYLLNCRYSGHRCLLFSPIQAKTQFRQDALARVQRARLSGTWTVHLWSYCFPDWAVLGRSARPQLGICLCRCASSPWGCTTVLLLCLRLDVRP